jgi:hypothetical protein
MISMYLKNKFLAYTVLYDTVHSLLMMNFSVTGVFGEIPAVIKYV